MMPLWVTRGKIIFFAHVPKTAGSSIEEYLLRRLGPCSFIGGTAKRRDQTSLMSPPVHLSKNDLKMFVPTPMDFNFGVVRDPLARMMSEFRYQLGVSWASRLGFSTWLRIVIRAAKLDPRIYANHIRPQVDLIMDGAEIFRLEDGFGPLIARLDEVVGGAEPDMAVQHINKRTSGSVRHYREDVALIRRFYADDYAGLGYPIPDLDTLPRDIFAPARAALARIVAPAIVILQHYRWLHPGRAVRRRISAALPVGAGLGWIGLWLMDNDATPDFSFIWG